MDASEREPHIKMQVKKKNFFLMINVALMLLYRLTVVSQVLFL